jgi:hypothetical protein
VHLVGFLFIVVIADARNHEPEKRREKDPAAGLTAGL